MMEDIALLIRADRLEAFAADVLSSVAVPIDDARIVAKALVATDLMGITSHGIIRLPTYVRRIRLGLVDPYGRIETVRDEKAALIIDAHNCLGHVSGTRAMHYAIERAHEYSIGAVAVRNSNHFGAAALYALMAVENDMIGFATTNSAPIMAPTGGCSRLVGNNPIAYGIPGGARGPLLLDIATSVVAGGRLLVAEKKHEQVPLGWVLDADGCPTSDPAAVRRGGTLVPAADHKGYGLAVVMDGLAGVLTGAAFGSAVGSNTNFEPNARVGAGHFFMAIKVEHFISIPEFRARMDHLIGEIKASPRQPGVDSIRVPGEGEFEAKRKHLRDGIPLPPQVVEELEQVAIECRVAATLREQGN